MRPAIILYISLLSGFTSCKKDKPAKSELQAMIACSMTKKLDSTAITATLNGSWIWKKQSIANTSEFRNADKDIKVTFNADSTFSLTENSNITMHGTWKLIYPRENEYSIRTDQYNQYVGGFVYFCDNQLLLVNSFVDGVDNLFEK